MNDSIERMRKLVNDNLVMGLRFQMNGELNKLESEIEQELFELRQQLESAIELVRLMDRDCRGCHSPCYVENGKCGIITLIDEVIG